MIRTTVFACVVGSLIFVGCSSDGPVPAGNPVAPQTSSAQPNTSGDPVATNLSVKWVGAVDYELNLVRPDDIIGPPDGVSCGFYGGSPAEGTFSHFGDAGTTTYSSRKLAHLLGIRKQDLAGVNFIAFEHNGTPNGWFESSDWTFDDGTNTKFFSYSFYDPEATPGVTSINDIDMLKYARFFGFTNSYPAGDNQALLFDLDGLDTASPDFSVTIQAYGYTGDPRDPLSPDPDAMGLIFPGPDGHGMGPQSGKAIVTR